MSNQTKNFTQNELEAIAAALADTSQGLTGSEITPLLAILRMTDDGIGTTKKNRLYNAFALWQNHHHNRTGILEFIRLAMNPVRYAMQPARFEPLRSNLNRVLVLSGLTVDATGTLSQVVPAQTLQEAVKRTQELRDDLIARGVHPDVIRFCRAELLADNYFHAVLEATKSIADKLRTKTGLTEDGATLVEKSLVGDTPLLVINAYVTDSHKNEQRGFANLVKGVFGMFRNTTAHEARILWTMNKSDAEDLLSLASLIHRRLDAATRPQRRER